MSVILLNFALVVALILVMASSLSPGLALQASKEHQRSSMRV
jgi:hypothetical protein